LDELSTKGVRSARLVARKLTAAKGSASLRVDAGHWPSAPGQLTTWLNANPTASAKDCPTP
jgi:hypothetical protein